MPTIPFDQVAIGGFPLLHNGLIDSQLEWLVHGLETPVYIYDERRLKALIDVALNTKHQAKCDLLYAVKASAFSDV